MKKEIQYIYIFLNPWFVLSSAIVITGPGRQKSSYSTEL
jgi:hypothetical protein